METNNNKDFSTFSKQIVSDALNDVTDKSVLTDDIAHRISRARSTSRVSIIDDQSSILDYISRFSPYHSALLAKLGECDSLCNWLDTDFDKLVADYVLLKAMHTYNIDPRQIFVTSEQMRAELNSAKKELMQEIAQKILNKLEQALIESCEYLLEQEIDTCIDNHIEAINYPDPDYLHDTQGL